MYGTFERFFVGLSLLGLSLLGLSLPPEAKAASPATTAGALRTYATLHSIGVEWDIEGDSDHDATGTVHYRVQGTSSWHTALSLFRIDYFGGYGCTEDRSFCDGQPDRAYNMLAGSILFLDSGTPYEVRLSLVDPDGGSQTATRTITTQTQPRLPTGGRTFHVVPGSGGGDGSSNQPFRGLAAAQQVAQPGDTFLLHAGTYPRFTLDVPGAPGRYIVWKAAGDGTVLFAPTTTAWRRGAVTIAASYVWLEGIHAEDRTTHAWHRVPEKGMITWGIFVRDAHDVVVTKNSVHGFAHGIWAEASTERLYITDNVVRGDWARLQRSDDKRHISIGIKLDHSPHHVVAHNAIADTSDGIQTSTSFAGPGKSYNIDLYGNDIMRVFDDAVELDTSYANIRMWHNRLTNYQSTAISFQPMFAPPWYILRNQIAVNKPAFLKLNQTGPFLLANNTLVMRHRAQNSYAQHLLLTRSRNNLWILLPDEADQDPKSDYLWISSTCSADTRREGHAIFYCNHPTHYAPDWRTNVDYDGFDAGGLSRPFVWQGTRRTLAEFAAQVGIEQHGLEVDKTAIFAAWPTVGATGEFPFLYLTLAPTGAAVDAGAAWPNIHDGYSGTAPDLGAYECGQPVPHYGPRHLLVAGKPPLVPAACGNTKPSPPRNFKLVK